MRNEIYWLALSNINGIGNKTLHKIYEKNQESKTNISDINNLQEHELSTKYKLKPNQITQIINLQDKIESLSPLLDKLNKNNIQIIAYNNPKYPQKIKNTEAPPFLIYYHGDLNLINEELIAIMGSRNISNRGLLTAYEFSKIVLKNGKVVIRGDTFDISRLGKIAADTKNTKEIVVLSNGILTYLNKNKNLQNKKLILSFVYPELDWTAHAEKHRNRLIFALADKCIVAESRDKGIIMTEVIKALKSNKKIFAVRYENSDKDSANDKLIVAGAIPITPSSSISNLREVIGEKTSINNSAKVRKELGQFFTPLTVVEFMYSMIEFIWQNDNLKKPLIIDPACGEGIFLKFALDKNITEGNNLYGVDIDESVRDKWNDLKIRNKMRLIVQDGLLDASESGIISEKFDLAIGNPPYGGVGLKELAGLINEVRTSKKFESGIQDMFKKEKMPAVKEERSVYPAALSPDKKQELIRHANYLATHYELWRKGEIGQISDTEDSEQSLFPEYGPQKPGKKRVDWILELEKQKLLGKGKEQLHLSKNELKRLVSFPIEILFLERFIQLIKPGSYIAIIVPDGILANYNLRFVRDWLFQKTVVIAIVSLPRETFKYLGTTAKTSILFLKKLRENESVDLKRTIFMAGAECVGVKDKNKNDLPEIFEKFKEFNRNPESFGREIEDDHNSPFFTKASANDIMREHCGRPEYWAEKYKRLIRIMKRHFQVKNLGSFIPEKALIMGDHARKSRGERLGKNLPYEYYDAVGFLATGYDYTNIETCCAKTYKRLKTTEVHKNDVLLACSGVGAVGRICLIHFQPKKSCTGAVFILRTDRPNPYYLTVFLKTKYGLLQIERYKSGVGTVNVRGDQIMRLQIPDFPNCLQKNIEKEYKEMLRWHDKAMMVKKKLKASGSTQKEAENDLQYQKYINKAESMLKDLIKRTEEVIEGKRKNI